MLQIIMYMKSFLSLIFFYGFLLSIQAQSHWQAPQSADELKNPLLNNPQIIEKGQKIYQSLCVSCHGADGTGNPVMVKSLNPPPADLSAAAVQNQTDGAIFWKISEGRSLMASYKNMISEEDRWALVHYIRSIKKNGQTTSTGMTKKEQTGRQTVDAFSFSQLINAKTTFIRESKGFGFAIQHRFGATKFDEGFIQNFMGLDLAANIRFSFEIPVSKKLMFEIGRTRYGKFYDLGGKYLFIKQTKDDHYPVSVAFYENIAITTENTPQYSNTATFENGTLFEYKFYHRLYYDTQIIISRKFSGNFSAQIAGQLVWRNLTPYSVKPKEESYVIAVPVSMRYKLGFKSAIDFEIMPNTQHRNMPISLGYEVASSGNHVFQITITNSDRILSQNLLFYPTLKYPEDGFMFGFNLIRYF